MNNEPFVIERVYNAPVASVWKALTDPEAIRKWSFNVSGFEPVVGYEFTFEGGKDERVYTHLSKVTEVIPGRKISYSWRYEGLEGNSLVTYELFSEGADLTKVRLTHTGIETMAANGPDFSRDSFSQGWTMIVGTLLKEYVERNVTI